MRLTAIKLAGFKSFVDPTTFRAPTNRTGIVGPNGCGKSNIIDAVRWVMGEGSARVLRGEQMADVIFSGSSTRKPVGTAQVELLFDNSDGQVAGEFAGFNEISVKRRIGRDGVSQYSLNGTRCRRKDITDLFLGTGLGPRSYSIIEQGMISQVVDAKPDELRGHLEEAAGISRYKERRRETERRIGHTRENLDRLNDLREEIGNHLSRLKRQARAAERYRKMKQERRELESRLLALQWKELTGKAEQGKSVLMAHETALQQHVAAQRKAEKKQEKLHQQQASASEDFNGVQGRLYEVSGEIARLEQGIKHAREMQARQQQEHEETAAALQDLEQHAVLDRTQVEDLTQKLAEAGPALKLAENADAEAEAELAESEKQVSDWQEQLEKHHGVNNELNRRADSLHANIELLDQRMQQAGGRLESLELERKKVDTVPLGKELEALEKRISDTASVEDRRQKQLDELRLLIKEKQQKLRDNTDLVNRQQREINTRAGRLESLRALQQASREESGGNEWLQQHDLATARGLASVVQVEPGWETAAETVLEFWLDAILVDEPADYAHELASLLDGRLGLVNGRSGNIPPGRGSLAEKVTAPDSLMPLLNSVMAADSLDTALNGVASAVDGETFITPAGEWVGAGWVRVARGQAGGQSGMLAREKEIVALEAEIVALSEQVESLQRTVVQDREALPADEQAFADLQSRVNAAHRDRARLVSERDGRKARMEDLGQRSKQITRESRALAEQSESDRKAIGAARHELEDVVKQMSDVEDQRSELDRQRGELLERRDDTQMSQLQQRFLTLSEQLAGAEDPETGFRDEMDALLVRRTQTEQELAEARKHLQQLEEDYRQQDANRQQAVQQADETRGSLERAKLLQQEIELNARNLERQVDSLGQSVQILADEIPEDADTESWQESIEKLGQRITRLEPVNLAAIQEYEEELKRKQYLDEQNEDLCDALVTLENAIAKIDRKTRTRFKETYERVNQGVKELFPRLFGGGHGYLELTGEDLLTTGVSIMARPPGKRVSNIHLLSGGEKALTAVAFVFAIFRLNPAPFCLLDEVDAPLDDANVGRFSALVGEMSETVQFIIVTHNKITMEMVHQLSGVTMREPGVSRLVQVDIEEAARLAAS
jgi:chromosome segregation protein